MCVLDAMSPSSYPRSCMSPYQNLENLVLNPFGGWAIGGQDRRRARSEHSRPPSRCLALLLLLPVKVGCRSARGSRCNPRRVKARCASSARRASRRVSGLVSRWTSPLESTTARSKATSTSRAQRPTASWFDGRRCVSPATARRRRPRSKSCRDSCTDGLLLGHLSVTSSHSTTTRS